MPKTSKWHAIAIRRKVGVYFAPWASIEPLVKGYRGKCHASFKTEEAALKFVETYRVAPAVKPIRNSVSKSNFLKQNPQLHESQELLQKLQKYTIQDEEKSQQPEQWTVPAPTVVQLTAEQARADCDFKSFVRQQLRQTNFL